MIGYSNTVTSLTSPIEFPFYSRICIPNSYMAVILRIVIWKFGWNQVGVIYMDNLFSNTLNEKFEQQAE